MIRSLIIYAVNIHEGGGKTLLSDLIKVIPQELSITLFVDARFDLAIVPKTFKVIEINPSVIGRLSAEIKLYLKVKKDDLILCFGNLPPIFKLTGHTILYCQNRFLVDKISLTSSPIKTRMRIAVERVWLSLMISNVDSIIVQTPSMRQLVEKIVKSKLIPIRILPFINNRNNFKRENNHKPEGA